MKLLVNFIFVFSVAIGFARAIEVMQEGNNLIVESTYGKKIIFGPLDFDSYPDFKVKLALVDLKPKSKTETSSTPAVHNFEGDEDKLFEQSNLSYQSGNFKGALQAVEKILARSPNNIKALVMQGSLRHALGQKDLAKKSWKKALELDPANAEIRRILEEYK